MPKLKCKCGYIHNLSHIPDDGWLTIQDKEYENLLEAEKIREKLSSEKENTDLFKTLNKADGIVQNVTGVLYECPKCKVLMWKKPSETKFTVYEICK